MSEFFKPESIGLFGIDLGGNVVLQLADLDLEFCLDILVLAFQIVDLTVELGLDLGLFFLELTSSTIFALFDPPLQVLDLGLGST